MIRSAKAIVRSPLWPELPPGTLVRISHLAFEANAQPRLFPATLASAPSSLLWIAAGNLLPYSSFLRRQPSSDFWMLALKQPLLSGEPVQFMTDPTKQTAGSTAFRFESLGEVVYYMKEYQLEPTKFKICFAGDPTLG